MNAKAKGRNLRISPLKLRKVIKLVSGKSLEDALFVLKTVPQKGAKMAYKVLFSAKANFKNRFPESDDKGLKILSIYVDQAPVMRRMMPRARGRADVLRKQSSHLSVLVGNEVNKPE
jgi:large subunit ribosomal protein L22